MSNPQAQPPRPSPFRPLWLIFLVLLAWTGYNVYRSFTRPAEIIPWRTDYEQAVADSHAQNKPLLLYFTASWCGPCQQMKSTTWADRGVEAELRRAVPLKIDIDQNPRLAAQYAVDAIPHLVLLTPGHQPRSTEGYLSPADFLSWLRGPSAPLPAAPAPATQR